MIEEKRQQRMRGGRGDKLDHTGLGQLGEGARDVAADLAIQPGQLVDTIGVELGGFLELAQPAGAKAFLFAERLHLLQPFHEPFG